MQLRLIKPIIAGKTLHDLDRSVSGIPKKKKGMAYVKKKYAYHCSPPCLHRHIQCKGACREDWKKGN